MRGPTQHVFSEWEEDSKPIPQWPVWVTPSLSGKSCHPLAALGPQFCPLCRCKVPAAPRKAPNSAPRAAQAKGVPPPLKISGCVTSSITQAYSLQGCSGSRGSSTMVIWNVLSRTQPL